MVIGSRENDTQSEWKRKNDSENGEGVSKKPKKGEYSTLTSMQ